MLGIKSYQIAYAHAQKKVEEPEWRHGKRAYTEVDIERLRKYFEAKNRVY